MKKLAYLGVLVFGLISFSNCAEYDYFGRILERGSRNVPEDLLIDENPDPGNLPPGIPTAPAGFTYQLVTNGWQQAGEVITNAEIVFVVDDSGSMVPDVQAIKSSLTGWVSELMDQGVQNYCLGAMEALTDPNKTGRLVDDGNGNKCACTYGNDALSREGATQRINDILSNAIANVGGNGAQEAMLYSAHQGFMNATAKTENKAAGCFRDDATLIYVMVSDENDICYAADNGANMFDNTFFLGAGQNYDAVNVNASSSSEASARASVCTNGTPDPVTGLLTNTLTHTSLVDDLQTYNGDLPTFGASIGYVDTTVANGFWGGIEFAEVFNYSPINIDIALSGNQAGFNQQMNIMAQDLATQISYFDSFSLSDQICDTNQDGSYADELPYVTVKVDGAVIPNSDWSIQDNGLKIVFTQSFVWSPEVEIETSYVRCEPI